MTDNVNEFDVPDGYQDDIGNPLEGEGVRLPFFAPYVWWQNGKNAFKQTGGAPYFGGWAMSDVDMAAAIAQHNDTLPLGWTSYDLVNDQGEDYTAFMTRWAYFAILGTRFRWIADETGQTKGKGQYQVLSYMAYQGADKKIVPFLPVVLTSRGTAGMFLKEAVIKFATQTAPARKKFANDLPISAFFATIGTYGQTPEVKTVGKAEGKKKIVTPLSLWLPEKIDEGYLHAAFLGKDLCALTSVLRKDAKEWLGAWKVAAKDQAAAAKPRETEPGEPQYVADPIGEPPLPDDVSPF